MDDTLHHAFKSVGRKHVMLVASTKCDVYAIH